MTEFIIQLRGNLRYNNVDDYIRRYPIADKENRSKYLRTDNISISFLLNDVTCMYKQGG